MGRTAKVCVLRVVAWLQMALAAWCVGFGLSVAEHVGWVLFALPPVMVAMVARIEVQRLQPGAGLVPIRRAQRPVRRQVLVEEFYPR